MNLRSVGFWAWDGYGGFECPRGWPHPRALVDPSWRPERQERERIAGYLNSGRRAAEYLGYSACRFKCGVEDQWLGTADLTDGLWLWPEGLAHYVLDHDIQLPDEMIGEMEAASFEMPAVPDVETENIDGSFWIEWCARHTRPPQVTREALSLSQAKAVLSGLATQGWQPGLESAEGRWRFTHSYEHRQFVDYLAPTTREDLEAYSHVWRVVSAHEALSIEEANLIARALGGFCEFHVMAASDQLDDSLLSEFGGLAGHVADGWIAEVRGHGFHALHNIDPLDEAGWRRQLLLWEQEAESTR